MGRAFSEPEKILVKESLIQAAYGLFSAQPYKQVTVESISKKAGVGKGTLYLFYPSKEHIFVEVMMRFEKRIQERIASTLQQSDTTKERLFKALLMGLEETEHNGIYTVLTDVDLMGRIMGVMSESDQLKMAEVDLLFMTQLLGDVELKVSRELAVDLLRGVFFIRFYESHFISNKTEFYHTFIKAIISQII